MENQEFIITINRKPEAIQIIALFFFSLQLLCACILEYVKWG
jgi:hypothetical protein